MMCWACDKNPVIADDQLCAACTSIKNRVVTNFSASQRIIDRLVSSPSETVVLNGGSNFTCN